MDIKKELIENCYHSDFISMVEFANTNNLYVGTGNPSSKILIIGKEAAISSDNTEQYNREMKDNGKDWFRNIETNTQFHGVSSWFEEHPPMFNPLYPYKNQLNRIEMRNSQGNVTRGHGGTSKTWHNYQRLMDSIYNNGMKSTHINFHKYAFCSELNQVTGKYSKDVPRKERMDSIQERRELFNFSFFRSFPITIIAVGHYVRDFEIDLQKMFDVVYHEEHSKELSIGMSRDFINIHYGKNDPYRLLIHTNQLSMVSSELTDRLGNICLRFLSSMNT